MNAYSFSETAEEMHAIAGEQVSQADRDALNEWIAETGAKVPDPQPEDFIP